MKVKMAYMSKMYPTKIIVELEDGRKRWANLQPARYLSEDDLPAAPETCTGTQYLNPLPAYAARVMYGLTY